MSQMEILSLVHSLLDGEIGLLFWHFTLDVLDSHLLVLNNLVELYVASVEGLCLFEVIVLLLNTIEALYGMLSKAAAHTSLAGNVLDESNHSLGAVGVELLVVTRLDLAEPTDSSFLCICVWVLTEFLLNVVAQVGDEAHAIVKLDVEGLIIDGGPPAWNYCL
jgi:hypothetical protein